MATYRSTKASATNPAPAHARHGENIEFQSVTISAAAASSDICQFFYVPANATIVGGFLRCTDIDTNGSPTVTIDVGDSGDTDRLFAASTIGRTGGVDSQLATTGLGYKYTSDTLIYATLGSVATGATGTIYLTLFYVVGL